MILDSIIRRSAVNLHKLINLTAVWKMKKNITSNDVDDCFSLLKTCIDSVRSLIVTQNKSTKQTSTILLLLKGGSMRIGNLYQNN